MLQVTFRAPEPGDEAEVAAAQRIMAQEGFTFAFDYSPDGEFSVLTDGFYVRLNDDEGSLQTTTSAAMIESGVGIAVDGNQRLTALIGLRWVDIDYDVRLGTVNGDFSADWIDPWIGARAVLPLNDTFALRLRGDVGGFGVGTDFTWQAIVVLAAALGSDVTIDVGYRGIGLDYDGWVEPDYADESWE